MHRVKKHYKKIAIAIVIIAIVIIAIVIVATYIVTRPPPEITFGSTMYISGAFSWFGELGAAAERLAEKEINEAGGVLGRPVKLVILDDETDAEKGFTNIKHLRALGACVILNAWGEIALLARDFLSENELPLISGNCPSAAFDTLNRWVWRTIPSDTISMGTEAKVVKEELGYDKAAVIYTTEEDVIIEVTPAINHFKELGGTIVAEIKIPPEMMSYTADVTRLFAENPEIVIMHMEKEDAVTVLKNAKDLGYNPVWFLEEGLSDPVVAELVGKEYLEGSYTFIPGMYLERPQYKDWIERLYEFSPLEPDYMSPRAPWAAYFYDAVIVAALAIEAAGSTDGEAIIEHLRDVGGPPGIKVYSYAEGIAELRKGNEIDYEGVSGSIDFDENGDVIAEAGGTYCKFIAGEWVTQKFVPYSE